MQNFEYYKVFYTAAKAGSVTKAAEQLFITQPAVSQSIKQLESNLEIQLFDRSSKGITLTDEGVELFNLVKTGYKQFEAAELKIEELKNMESGEVSIGASDTVCKYYLLPYLQLFHKRFPSINIKVTNRISKDTIKLLKEGEVDLGFINMPFEDSGIEIKKVKSIHDCFVVGKKLKHISDNQLDLKELVNLPIMLLEKGSSTRYYIDKYFKNNNLNLIPEIELGSLDLLVDFAKIGLGVSGVIKEFIEADLLKKELFELKLNKVMPSRNIGIVTLPNRKMSTASKNFINCIELSLLC